MHANRKFLNFFFKSNFGGPSRFFEFISHVRFNSQTSSEEIRKIRNIGIIAHIDAGKTTTTERMLYYSGFTRSLGEVHDGDTVMDYMPQERERGITITSAGITFKWKKHKLNLIDTPGHVDFTFEVERSLSVLDGAITILDASAGVEVQTLKVWEQAKKYGVPCLIYLNKMDKPASNIHMCLESVSKKLKVKPLLLHSPVGHGKEFGGVMDLIRCKKYTWNKHSKDGGMTFSVEDLSTATPDKSLSTFQQKRRELVESIAELDDAIGEKFITEGSIDSISEDDLVSALRRITSRKTAVPVLCGSSYKNVAVQLLMDAVVDFLPSPSELNSKFGKLKSDDFSALVFKIIHSKNKEPLTFLRIYSGSAKCGQRVFNKTRQSSEKIAKLFVPLADELKEVSSLSVGSIAVATGFKEAVTGDVLFSSPSASERVDFDSNFAGVSIQVPDPVFFCTIEPPSQGFQKQLDFALQCLQREDPTFQVEVDENIGQTIVMGMGELHIDVIRGRIKEEYGIDAYLGPLQVAYREAPEGSVEHTHVVDKSVAGSKQYVKLTLRAYPSTQELPKLVKVIVTKENELGNIRQDHLKAVSAGVRSGLRNGPVLGFPVINVGLDLLWLEVGRGTSPSMLTAAASQCLTAALRKSRLHLLEPVMNVSVVAGKGYGGRVLSDLAQRRSQILGVEQREDVELILARTPLSSLRGYSTHLRALTAGTCSLTLEFDSYQKMEQEEQAKTIEEVTGF